MNETELLDAETCNAISETVGALIANAGVVVDQDYDTNEFIVSELMAMVSGKTELTRGEAKDFLTLACKRAITILEGDT